MTLWDWLLAFAGVWALFSIAGAIRDSEHTLRQCKAQLERIGNLIEYDDDD